MKIKIIATAVVMIIVTTLIGISLYFSFNDTQYTVTVTDKERVMTAGNSYYLVFAEDESGNIHVFKNVDEILRFKFDSSDIQAQLKKGNTYTLTVVGIRIPFLSTYQNIVKVDELTTE